VLDKTGWLSHYKVQPGTNSPPDSAKLAATVKRVFYNQIFYSTPFIAVAFYALHIFGPTVNLGRYLQVPSFERLILEFAFHYIAYEIGFYYSHRYDRTFVYFKIF